MVPEYFVGKRLDMAPFNFVVGSILGSVAGSIVWAMVVSQTLSLPNGLRMLGFWLVAVIVVLTILRLLKRTPGFLVLSKDAFGIRGVGSFNWSDVARITSHAHPQVKRWGRVPHWSSTYEFELKDGRILEIDLDKFADKDKDAVANAISIYAVTYNGIPVHLV